MFSFIGAQKQAGRYIFLPAETIKPNPNQPRKIFDSAELSELAASITLHGIIQPLLVRRISGGYELVAGERRLRAAKLAGLEDVPCVVLRVDGEQSSVMALIENLQRAGLDFFEEAQGYRLLMDTFGLTQETVAQRVGRSQSAVANKLRLLRLDKPCVDEIRRAGLTERHARALLKLDQSKREAALAHIVKNDLNVARAEEYIARLIEEDGLKPLPRPAPRPIIKDIRFFFNSVDRAVGLIKQAGVPASCEREEMEDSYKIVIHVPKNH